MIFLTSNYGLVESQQQSLQLFSSINRFKTPVENSGVPIKKYLSLFTSIRNVVVPYQLS